MYAVVSTGGKQLKVSKDDLAVIEKLDVGVGDSVSLPVVLVADGDTIVFDAAGVGAASVTAEVVEHFKGEKQLVFKFKRRKGYKKTRGHRQDQTRVRIVDITMGEAKPKRATKSAAKAETDTTDEAPAPKKRATKKSDSSATESAESAE